MVLFVTLPCSAQYTNFRLIEPREGTEPQPRAILYSSKKSCALLHYKDEHLNVVDGFRIDKEWNVKEIKRESIIFGKASEKRYIEYYIDPAKRPRNFDRNWSFYGLPISIWEAIELISNGFGYSACMHYLSTGAVVPQHHGINLKELIDKTLPVQHFARTDDNTLYVFPANVPNEKWVNVFNRRKKYSHKALSVRFPGLAKKGVIKSRGDDIQYVLRVISRGGEVPISYPKDMHFAVYGCFNDIPFSKILCDIVYTNQCVVVEREKGIDIIPWSAMMLPANQTNVLTREPVEIPKPRNDLITSDPANYDEKSGSGPYPPPLITDPFIVPAVIADKMEQIVNEEPSHPLVHQSFEPASITSRFSGEKE